MLRGLLDWIERCDLASRNRQPKPPCLTLRGAEIIPTDSENLWWLLDQQRRKPPAAEEEGVLPAPPDEDGVASSQGDDQLMSDEESTTSSEHQADEESDHPPYEGYFEHQKAALCGVHALNMAVGRPWQSAEDLEYALEDYLRTAAFEQMTTENREQHTAPGGWYSSEILAHAVNTTSMNKTGRIEYVLELEPLYMDPAKLHRAVGALVNVEQRHWVALRSLGGKIWLLDSEKGQAGVLSNDQYIAYVWKNRDAFPIHWATDMKSAKKVSDSQASTAAGSSLASLVSHDTQESPVLPTVPSSSQASRVSNSQDTPPPDAAAEDEQEAPSKKARRTQQAAAGSTLASLASFDKDSPVQPIVPSTQDETPLPPDETMGDAAQTDATTENPPPSKKARTDEQGSGTTTQGFCEVLEIAEQISPERWAHG